MGKLLDLVASYSEMDERPETMLDDILAAHDEDISGYQATIDTLTQDSISAAENSKKAILTLKTQNYDLMMSNSNSGDIIEASDNAGGGAGDDEAEEVAPEAQTLDSVFTEQESK